MSVAHAGIGLGRLLVRIETVIVALVLARFVVRQLVQFEPLLAHLLLVDRRRVAGEDRVPVAVLVVDRHVPLRDRHLLAHRDDEAVREKLVGDAHMRPLRVDLAQRDQPQAVFGVLDIDDRAVVFAQDLRHRHVGARRSAAELLAVGRRRILILEEAMQEGGVRRIDADFQRLQPVAIDVALEREGMAVGRDEAVDLRKGRRFAFAEISPEDAALLDHRIGALLDALAQLASPSAPRAFPGTGPRRRTASHGRRNAARHSPAGRRRDRRRDARSAGRSGRSGLLRRGTERGFRRAA